MKRLCELLLGLVVLCCASVGHSRTLQYPVIFIHGIWSDATTWETAIKQLVDRNYTYGGVISASYVNGVPSTADCVRATVRDNKNPAVYLVECKPDADFYVWETNDYSASSSRASNHNHSFSELGGEVKFAIDYVKNRTGAAKVQLVGHSMGGIAARHYLQNLHRSGADYAGDVATLVTIGTPHLGSGVANTCPILAPVATSLTLAYCVKVARPDQVADCYDAARFLHTICAGEALTRLRADSWAIQIMNTCLASSTGLCSPDNVSAGKPHTLPSGVNYLSIVAGLGTGRSDGLVSAASQEIPPAGAYPKQVMTKPMNHLEETSSPEVLAAVLVAVGATNNSQASVRTLAPRVDIAHTRFAMVGAVEANRANVAAVTVDTYFRYAFSVADLGSNFFVMPNARFVLAPGASKEFWAAAFTDARLPLGRLVYYQACVAFSGISHDPCDDPKSLMTALGNVPLSAPSSPTSLAPRTDPGAPLVTTNVTLPIVLSWTAVPNATSYKVYVVPAALAATLPTGASTVECGTCLLSYVVDTNSALIGADQLRDGQDYAWVVAAASDDLAGYWSNVSTFSVAPAGPSLLPAPAILTPANAAVTTDDHPVFAWNPVATATSYRLLLARTASALPVDPTVAECASCVINTIADREGRFMPAAGVLQPGETYFWRVKARSPSQYGALSSIYTFTVPQLSASACNFSFVTPQLTVPTPGATFNASLSSREGCSPVLQSNQSWCALSGVPARVGASGSAIFTVSVDANPAASARTCLVSSGTSTMTITQAGTAPLSSYSLTVSQQPGGSTTPSGTSTVSAGNIVTVTATPLPGYSFIGWYENAALVWSGASYSFPINAPRTLVAYFTATGQYDYVGLANVPDGRDYADVRWRASGNGLTTFTWQRYGETISIPAATPSFRVDCADTPFAQAVPQTFNQGNGYNPTGYFFACNYVSKGVPRLSLSTRAAAKIATNAANAVALLDDGRVVLWGSRQLTDLTHYSPYANARGWGFRDQAQSRPVFVNTTGVTAVSAESDGTLPSLLVRDASGWKGWGAPRGPFVPTLLPDRADVVLQRGSTSIRTGGRIYYKDTYKGTVADAVDVAGTADDLVYVLRADGAVVSLPGANDSATSLYCYLLGQNSNAFTNCSRPSPLPLINQAVSISASSDHAYVVRSDGTVWVWGRSVSGVVPPPGIGTRTGFAPVQVPGVTNAVSIESSADGTTFVRTSGGQVYAWGTNSGGRLGLPTSSTAEVTWTPHLISGLSNVREIAINNGYEGGLVAVDNAGFVWAVGVLRGWNVSTAGTGTDLLELSTPAQVVCPSGYTGFLNIDSFSSHCSAAPNTTLNVVSSFSAVTVLVDGQPVTLPYGGTFPRGQTVTIGLLPDVGQGVGVAGDVLVAQRFFDLPMNRDWTVVVGPGNCLGLSLRPPGVGGASAVYVAGQGGVFEVPVYDSQTTTCHWKFATTEPWLIGSGEGVSGGTFQIAVEPNPTTSERVAYLQLLGPTGGNTGVVIQAAGTVNTQPAPFGFSSRSGVEQLTLVQSESVAIQGINAPAPVTVSAGSEYSLGCTGTFTAGAGTISNGETVCVRHTSASGFGAATTSTLTVGGVSGRFDSVTASLACRRAYAAGVEPLRFSRYLRGLRGEALVQGTLLPGDTAALLGTSEQAHFDNAGMLYDFNGDGLINDIDATLYLRFALGFRGTALTTGIAIGPARTPQEIANILAACP